MRTLGDGWWWLKRAIWKKWDDVVARYLRWLDEAPERGHDGK